MKVYLVDISDGGSFEDYEHGIHYVSSSYRKASDWLIESGYEPYTIRAMLTQELELRFIKEVEDEDYYYTFFADIREMILDE